MRMSEIDGATLLNVLQEESPATVRILLSGYARDETFVRVLPALL
jgi:response regulator RpfG family c-di-GMP phosphodiesterase